MKGLPKETVERAVRMYPSATAASRALRVSWATLRRCCQEYGVEIPDKWSRRKKDSGPERPDKAVGKGERKRRKRSDFGRRVCLGKRL